MRPLLNQARLRGRTAEQTVHNNRQQIVQLLTIANQVGFHKRAHGVQLLPTPMRIKAFWRNARHHFDKAIKADFSIRGCIEQRGEIRSCRIVLFDRLVQIGPHKALKWVGHKGKDIGHGRRLGAARPVAKGRVLKGVDATFGLPSEACREWRATGCF
jgi:hypothetical protein